MKQSSLWHYEFIKERTEQQWRVGNQDDDPVGSFDSETEAAECVRAHNTSCPPTPTNWKYGDK